LLAGSRAWRHYPIHVGEIEIASNSLRIELLCPNVSESGLWLSFQEQSGRLVAGILNSGWLLRTPPERNVPLADALAGFYKLGGVDLIREQVEACFEPNLPPYDITETGLVVWPGARYEHEILYNLDQSPTITPRPRSLARSLGCPILEADQILYAARPIAWDDWVSLWDAEQSGGPLRELFEEKLRLLPTADRVPLAGEITR